MLAMAGLGWALPALLVRSRAKSRRTGVERAIPDMMDMLNMCVSQGLTVPDSLARIAQDLKPVYPGLAQELSIVVDQAKVGTLNEALQNFAERIDLPQVDSFFVLDHADRAHGNERVRSVDRLFRHHARKLAATGR